MTMSAALWSSCTDPEKLAEAAPLPGADPHAARRFAAAALCEVRHLLPAACPLYDAWLAFAAGCRPAAPPGGERIAAADLVAAAQGACDLLETATLLNDLEGQYTDGERESMEAHLAAGGLHGAAGYYALCALVDCVDVLAGP